MASASYSDIKINIKTSADSSGIKDATKAVKEYSAAVSEASNKSEGLSKTSSVLERTTSSAVAQATEKTLPRSTSSIVTETEPVAADQSNIGMMNFMSGLSTRLGDAFDFLANAAGTAKSAVGKFLDTVGNVARSKMQKFTSGLNNIISSFKRIAFYRFIRTVIKEITEGFKEGVDNLYQWSKLANGEFAQSMDRIATSTLYMKNSLGAMVAPLINAIAPAIDFLIDKFVALLNVINRVFALFTGAGYWTKAKKYPTEYAKAVSSGAGKAADALHKLGLAQIDELTILDKNHGDTGSGGGGGDALDYNSMFETEKLGGGIWDKVKAAIENGDWRGAGKILAEKLNEIVAGLDTRKWGRELGTKINNGLEFAYGFLKYTDFKQIGGKIANFINGGLESINFNTAGRLMTRKVTALYDTLIGFVTTLDWGLVGKSISDYIIGSFQEWNEWLEGIDWYKLGTDLRMKFDAMIENIEWEKVGQEVLTCAKNAIDAALKLGIGIILPINDIEPDARNVKATKLLEKLKTVLNPVTFGLIGWVVGGPGGAALGATIGLGITFALTTDLVDKTNKYGERINEVVGKHTRIAQQTIDQAGTDSVTKTDSHFKDMESKISMSLSSSSSIVHNKTGDISKEISRQWSGIEQDTDTSWGGVVRKIGEKIDEAKKKLDFKWSFPEIKLPHIPTPKFHLETGIMGIQYPKFDGWFASGGFPSTGSLFIANEAGPEMVGSMGSRTAVANNDQIVAGISQGVYEAVRDALGDGNQAVNVYLDGKQISGSVVKNINSETRRTGSSPLLSY